MPEDKNHLLAADTIYDTAFEAIKDFFRYERRHPDAELNFDDAYYAKVAEMLKKRIDHEIKYLHSNVLT